MNKVKSPYTLSKEYFIQIRMLEVAAPAAYERWMREPIDPELTTVPGIGKAGKEILENVGVFTTWQLISTFLQYNRDIEKFSEWLGGYHGFATYNSTITRSIAEKVAVMCGDWVPY